MVAVNRSAALGPGLDACLDYLREGDILTVWNSTGSGAAPVTCWLSSKN
jgi:hypothetical protein